MLNKQQKQQIVAEMSDKFKKQKSVIFADYRGMKVNDARELRSKLKKSGVEYKVAKKNLIKLALKESQLNLGEDLDIGKLEGQIAFIFNYGDEAASAKIVNDFIKTGKSLKILGGLLGSRLLEDKEIIALAKLPSILELQAKLVGTIAAPLSGFARTLQGNISKLVFALQAIKDSKS